MTDRFCRWGILGTANIARKNWQGIRLAGNATLVGVASRSQARAQQFIDECQSAVPFAAPPRAIGSYEELINAKDVDALYIPLPTTLRKEWVLRAAAAKKHVLVEKPVGVTAEDVTEILAACQKNNVQFMDGVMFMHGERLAKMRETLDDGKSVGDIRRIVAQFTFRSGDDFLQKNIRANAELEPLGCVGDLGWYTIRLALWAMKYQLPVSVTSRTLKDSRPTSGSPGVPLEFTSELFFADGVTASLFCSFLVRNQQWGNIGGTDGFLHVKDFVIPIFSSSTSFTTTSAGMRVFGCDFNNEETVRTVQVPEYSHAHESAQEVQMFREFSRLAMSGRTDDAWGDIAWKTQRVIDACLESAAKNGASVTL
jgi:predicted dehydrogenase